MTNTDPAARLTSTFTTDDLRSFVDGDGPFATVMLPAPSGQFGGDHRFEVMWKHARRRLEQLDADWSSDRLDELEAVVAELHHSDAPAFVIIQRADGVVFVEHLNGELKGGDAVTEVADHPRLLEIIDDRQRTLPHIVVDTDRAGATVTGFDAGRPTGSEQVEGDTEHIHRVRGGGWSHRRYQQRAENTWERNAGDVADVVAEMARQLDPVLIAVTGEVRAKQFLHEALDHEFGDVLVDIEAGDLDGVSSEVVDQLADRRARFQVAILERFRDQGGITDPGEVEAALREGRVETLLVSGPTSTMDDGEVRARLDAIGAAITAALTTSAAVVVVPQTAEMSGGLAALARW